MRVRLLSPALAALLLASCAGSGDTIDRMPKRVLIFPAGGWIDRQPTGFAAEPLRAAGFKPVRVNYPLHDLAAADSYARKIAREYRDEDGERPYALGFSAGGSIVACLAARDLVRKAVTVGGPSNLHTWDFDPSALAALVPDPDPDALQYDSHWDRVPATKRQRWRASPTRAFEEFGPHPSHLVVMSHDDGIVPFSEAQDMVALSHGDLNDTVEGVHSADEPGGYFVDAVPIAIDWLGG